MKLAELIQEVMDEKPNSFKAERLTAFVSEVEAEVQEYLGVDDAEKIKYDWKEDGSRELIVTAPYDILYKSYLKARIDYTNEEYQSYTNNQAQFNSDMDEWKAWAMRSGLVKPDEPLYFRNWW